MLISVPKRFPIGGERGHIDETIPARAEPMEAPSYVCNFGNAIMRHSKAVAISDQLRLARLVLAVKGR